MDIFKGFRGSPRHLDGSIEAVGPFDLFGKPLYFNILNISSMVRIKVECCLTREEPRDFEDVKFMVNGHTPEVRKALITEVVDEEDLYEVLQHEKMGDKSVRDKLMKMLSFGEEDQGG